MDRSQPSIGTVPHLGNHRATTVSRTSGQPPSSQRRIGQSQLQAHFSTVLTNTAHVAYWHFADIAQSLHDIRFWALNGHQNCGSRLPVLTPNGHRATLEFGLKMLPGNQNIGQD
jgi:hypothetical protein